MGKTSFLKEPVGGQSIVNKIVDNITNAIINEELSPGDKVPTEAELSESIGVGRSSVREAIKVLEAYGVIHIKWAEGTFVSREYDSGIIYPILYGTILQKGSTSQIVELRKVISVGLLQLAMDKLKSRSLEQTQMEVTEKAMEELEYQAYIEKPRMRSLYEADVQFHMAIVGITENMIFQSICNCVDEIIRRSHMATIDRVFLDGEVGNFLNLHRRTVELLQNRDPAGIYTIVEEHYQYWTKLKDEQRCAVPDKQRRGTWRWLLHDVLYRTDHISGARVQQPFFVTTDYPGIRSPVPWDQKEDNYGIQEKM